MITCSKTFSDIPLSHRQPFHKGRCSRIHGHSWAITLTFAASEMDENGFVMDFGDLHFIRDWIDENLDHASIFRLSDPFRKELEKLEGINLLKIIWVESCSCEGIAKFLYEQFKPMVEKETKGRATLLSLKLDEDSRNSATYQPSHHQ